MKIQKALLIITSFFLHNFAPNVDPPSVTPCETSSKFIASPVS